MAKETQKLQTRLNAIQEQFSEVEQAYQSLQQSFEQMQKVYEFAFALSNVLELDKLCDFVRDYFRDSLATDGFALAVWDAEQKALAYRAGFGLSRATALALFDNSHDHVEEPAKPRTRYDRDLEGATPGTIFTMQLYGKSGQLLGGLAFHRAEAEFTDAERTLLVKLAELLQVVLEKVLLFEQTRSLSLRDELTGLYNRRFFNQTYERELQRCQRYNRSLAILMVDIDHFKRYNDRQGHVRGDEVLRKVAETLQSNLRKSDIVARYGGEEFVILLPEVTKEQAKKVAAKLRRRIEREPFPFEETQPGGKLTISVGLAAFPEDSQDPEALLVMADESLYAAKTQGKNRVHWPGKRTKRADRKTLPAA